AAGFAKQRLDVLDLAIERPGRGVAAFATAAAIVDVDREVVLQERSNFLHRPEATMTERAVHEEQRRPLALLLEGDRGAVFRAGGRHGSLPLPYFLFPSPCFLISLNRSTAAFGSKSSSSNS